MTWCDSKRLGDYETRRGENAVPELPEPVEGLLILILIGENRSLSLSKGRRSDGNVKDLKKIIPTNNYYND
jgi:hypothetical protein